MSKQNKGLVGEFKEFLLRGNVVDLAVAVVVGVAFGAVVTALVADIITPIVAAVFGKADFSALSFKVHKSTFRYGHFLNAVISFVTIAAAVFFLVVKPVNYLLEVRKRRMAAGADEDASTLSDEALLLTEIRDLLRAQRDAG